MDQPRTPVNGISQENELTRRLQQRLHIIEGGGVPRELPREHTRDRNSLGGPPSVTSPRQTLPANGTSTVYVQRAQPRQQTWVRAGGGFGFPPPTSGNTSPAYPWPLGYAGPPSAGGFQAPRTSDPLSRSAPGAGALQPGQTRLSMGSRQALAVQRDPRPEVAKHVRSMNQHLDECNGMLTRGSQLSEDASRLLSEVQRLKLAKGELSEEMAQAQAETVNLRQTHEEYQQRFAAERAQLILAKDELLAENANLWDKDRCHEVAEEKLIAERNELVEEFYRSRDATEERNRYRLEAETLRRERNDLQAQNRELQADNARLEAQLVQLSTENQALQSISGASCSGCRLRATLTKQSSSIEELSSAINGVDSLLEQARRELRQQELREKRAALEELHHAMALKLDEDALDVAIARAKRAGVAQEDIDKAQAQLAELLSLTPEEKARRVALQVEKARKEEAFTFAKRDRVAELEKLLEELGEGVAWENWHDSQGRTLLRVAQQLHSENAIKVLEDRIERKHPGTLKPPETVHHHARRVSRDLSTGHRPSTGSFQEESGSFLEIEGMARQNSRDLNRQGSGSMVERRPSDLSMMEQQSTLMSAASSSMPPSPKPMAVQLVLPEEGPAVAEEGGAVGSTAQPGAQPPSPGTGQLAPPPTASWRSWYEDDQPVSASLPPAAPEAETGPGRPSAEEEEKLKTEAFRSCARGDAEKLQEILESVPLEVWEKWQNKAGKDLEQLCHERGEQCQGALRVIFQASGRVRAVEREYFEEGEHVWVHVKGEVLAREATVKEDTPIEEDTILIEFTVGYDDPLYVDRGIVSKRYGP